MWMANYS